MSQRVQKGSTVFRPVARPRARLGTDSRQSSVLPEPAPSVVGLSRVQEGPRATPAMPPPSVVPQRPTGEVVSDAEAVSSSTPTDSSAARDSIPQPFLPSSSRPPVITPSPPTVRSTPSRMPPMVTSSQRSSHNHILSQQRNPFPPQSVMAPMAPIISPSAHATGLTASDGNVFNGLHAVHPQLPGLVDGHFSNLPFSIDNSQIDPQLIGSSAAFGLPPLGPQGVPLHGSSLDNRQIMTMNNISQKIVSPHRTTRRGSDPESAGVDRDGEEGANSEWPLLLPRSFAQRRVTYYTVTASVPARRKRSKKVSTGADENASESVAKQQRTPGSHRSRTRPPSPPPFDHNTDPGEELDPTVVTMAALCDDTGRGRVSSKAAQIVSNHAAWRAANREKRARLRAIMEAKKYGRNLDEEEEAPTQNAKGDSQSEPSTSALHSETPTVDPITSIAPEDDGAEKEADGFDYAEDLAISRFNVQVRIGANGETIIDEDSLFVNRDEEHRTEDYTHVEESDFTKFVNSATYSKKVRGSRWSAEETQLFYDALSQFGENYELISYVLPGRDRKACKNKFKTEDRKNPGRITYCLNNRRPYDIATLSRMTGKDFSGPTPEIRAPTPIRSAELETATEQPPAPTRKKSKAPTLRDTDAEIIGELDDIDKEDI